MLYPSLFLCFVYIHVLWVEHVEEVEEAAPTSPAMLLIANGCKSKKKEETFTDSYMYALFNNHLISFPAIFFQSFTSFVLIPHFLYVL